MSFLSKVGSFNIDTTKTIGQTQAISGVGFTPKIVLFWWTGSTATTDSVGGGDSRQGFGAAISSSSRFSLSYASLDGLASTTCLTIGNYTYCIGILNSVPDNLEGVMDFSSMDADGFTLIVDDQFSNAYRISYLALGGDDLTNVYIGKQAMPTSLGNYNVTGVGFQPDALITAYGFETSDQIWDPHSILFLGMATSSSEQGVVTTISRTGQSTTETYGYGYNGETIWAGLPWYSQNTRESFVSFGADGFTMNHLEWTTNAVYYYFICLKGGRYKVGDILTRTDGNDIVETVGFQPKALLFASANRALSTQDTVSDHARLSIGAGTSTSNRAVQATSNEDNLADSETARANYDSAVYANIADDAIVGLMDLKSIDSNGFTCVMDDTDPSECWVTYMAFGNVSYNLSINNATHVQKSGVVPEFGFTPILDNFDRGDGALGSNWSDLSYAKPYSISSNAARVYQAAAGDFEGGSYWNPTTFGSDSECYATVSALPTNSVTYFGLEARVIDAGANRDGYHIDWEKDGTFTLYKITDGVYTMMGTSVERTMTAGYKFGIRVTGSSTTTVKAYTDEGSGWVERLSRDDSSSPHTAAGNLAMHFYLSHQAYETSKLDNFGGGTVNVNDISLIQNYSLKEIVIHSPIQKTVSGPYVDVETDYILRHKYFGVRGIPVDYFPFVYSRNIDLTQHIPGEVLTSQSPIQIQVSDSILLKQNYVLSIRNAIQTQTSAHIVLLQNHVSNVQNATQIQTSPQVVLKQNYLLSVQNTIQIQTTSNIVLVQHAIGTANNAVQIQTSPQIVLKQNHLLVVQNAIQAQTIPGIVLIQHILGNSNDAVQAQTCAQVVLKQNYLLIAQNAAQIQTSPNIILTQNYATNVQNSPQIQTSTNIVLLQNYVLGIRDSVQVQTGTYINLGQGYYALPENAAQLQTSDNVGLIQHHVLIVDNTTHKQKYSQQWWLTETIDNSNVSVAYAAENADSYAISKINLIDPETNNLCELNNIPAWSNVTGWNFFKLSNMHLTNYDFVSVPDIYTIIIKFSNASDDIQSDVLAFLFFGDSTQAAIYPSKYTGGVFKTAYTDDGLTLVSPSIQSGILAGVYDIPNQLVTGYRNGNLDLPTTSDPNLSYDGGHIDIGTMGTINIQLIAMYNIGLTQYQIMNIGNRMSDTGKISLIQHHVLEIQSPTQPQTSDKVGLIQNYVLTTRNATQLQETDISIYVTIVSDTFSRTDGSLGYTESFPKLEWVGSTWSVSSGSAINTPTSASVTVLNPSFETGEPPDNWLQYNTPTTFERSSTQKQDGNYSLHIVADHNGDGAYQNSLLTIGKYYKAEAYIYPVVFTDYYGILNASYFLYLPLNQWTKLTAVAKTETNYFYFYHYNSANAYWDNIKISELNPSDFISTVDSGNPNISIQADITLASLSNYRTPAGLILKANSSTNPSSYIKVALGGYGVNNWGVCLLYKVVNNVETYIGGIQLYYGGTAYQDKGTLFIKSRGNTVSITYRNYLLFSATINDTEIINNTIHGLYSTSEENKFDNFYIKDYSGTLLLKQNFSISVNDATQVQTSSNIQPSQGYVLSVNNTTQNQTASTLLLTQNYSLTTQNAVQIQTTSFISLAQNYILGMQNAIEIQTSTSPNPIPSGAIGVNNSIHTQVANNVNLTQHYIIGANNPIQIQTVPNITVGMVQTISVNSTTHIQSSYQYSATQDDYILTEQYFGMYGIPNRYYPSGVQKDLVLTYHGPVISLVPENVIHVQTSGNVILTQKYVIPINNSTQKQVSDNIVLSQIGLLGAQNVTQAQAVSDIALKQNYRLNTNNAIQLQTTPNIVLSQHNIGTANNAVQIQTSNNIILKQNYLLSVQNPNQIQTTSGIVLNQNYATGVHTAVQIQATPSIALTQHHVLGINNSVQIQISTSPTPIPSGAIGVNDGAQIQVTSVINLVQNHALVSQSATQKQVTDNIVLAAKYTLAVQNSVQAQTSNKVTLIQNYLLIVNNSAQIQTSPILNLTQDFVLSVNNGAQIQTSPILNLTQDFVLITQSIIQKQTSDYINISQGYKLVISNIIQKQVSDKIDILLHTPIVVRNAIQIQTSTNISLVQHNILSTIDNSIQIQGSTSPILVQRTKLTEIQDATQIQTSTNILLVFIPFYGFQYSLGRIYTILRDNRNYNIGLDNRNWVVEYENRDISMNKENREIYIENENRIYKVKK